MTLWHFLLKLSERPPHRAPKTPAWIPPAESGRGTSVLLNRTQASLYHSGRKGRWVPEADLTHVFAKRLTVGCAEDFKLDVGIRAVLPKLHHPCEAGDVALQRQGKTIGARANMNEVGDGTPRQGRKGSGGSERNNQGLGEPRPRSRIHTSQAIAHRGNS